MFFPLKGWRQKGMSLQAQMKWVIIKQFIQFDQKIVCSSWSKVFKPKNNVPTLKLAGGNINPRACFDVSDNNAQTSIR